MITSKIQEDKTRIASILEQSISLFQRTGMCELASKWERILKTYTTKRAETLPKSA